ncbi:MAG: hypothetical protein ACLQDY_10380 [Streptosporangiaceae bacterium]
MVATEQGEGRDITDWTALTPDDFFAALKAACQTRSVPATTVRETYVTITDGVVVAVLPRHDWIQEGTHVGPPGRAATTKPHAPPHSRC